VGGEFDAQTRYISPTILDDVTWDDEVMRDEIFGPILPIITYSDTQDMIKRVKAMETPLAFYIFSSDKKMTEKYLNEISSGDVVINDTLLHFANHHLPFGGKGYSGIGAYHGKHSLETFSHKRSVVSRNQMLENPLRYPPYEKKLSIIKKIL
jgi:acyl-CoA reductase-like NAD-dependent aldehyde dehydrogenase